MGEDREVRGEAHVDKLLKYTKAMGDHVAKGAQLAEAADEELRVLAEMTVDLSIYKECDDLVQCFKAFMELWNKRSQRLKGPAD